MKNDDFYVKNDEKMTFKNIQNNLKNDQNGHFHGNGHFGHFILSRYSYML